MSQLEILTNNQLKPLLVESEHAFLPTKNSPDETAMSLIEEFQDDQKYDALGYVIGDKAVSYIIALSGRADSEIAIGPMYVAEEFRGNGLGSSQVADFIQRYTQQGYESVYTKTWLGNAAARRSFEQTGFTEAKRKDSDRINGDSTVAYALRIPKP